MKISLVFVVVTALCLSMTSAQPVVTSLAQNVSLVMKDESESPGKEIHYFDQDSLELLDSRLKRGTCDLLSRSKNFGFVSHVACATHCLVMKKGYKGGRCRDGVCYCTK